MKVKLKQCEALTSFVYHLFGKLSMDVQFIIMARFLCYHFFLIVVFQVCKMFFEVTFILRFIHLSAG